MMASEVSTLLLLAVVVALASLASYWLSQWRARDGGQTFTFAGLGIGTGLMLAAVFLLVLGVVLIVQQWVSRLDGAMPESENAIADIARRPNPFDSVSSVSGEPTSDERTGLVPTRARAQARSDENRSREVRPTEPSSAAGVSTEDIIARKSVGGQRGTGVLSASDPWAATRCVVPVRREWDDGTRWTIVNDCGVAVAILIAVCARPESECSSRAWRYPEDGLTLPAKHQRSVTEAEQTQYANELRHAACVVTDPTAVVLMGLNGEERNTPDRQRAFAEARLRDACLSEVRRLSVLGAAYGRPIEAMLGARLYSRAER